MSEPSFSSRFLRSAGSGDPLRVGVILDERHIARASASILRDLLAAEFVSLELAIVDRPEGGDRPTRPFDRHRAEGGRAFAAFAVVDLRRTGSRDDPFEPEDVSGILAGVPTLAVERARNDPSAWSVENVERVRAAGLDVLVHLGARPLVGPILASSRLGVWALRHGDLVRYRCGPVAFWELADGNPTTSVELRRLDRAASLVLDRATFATDPTSLARTRRTAVYGSTHLVVRNLRLLHARGWPWLQEHRPTDAPEPGPHPSRNGPPTTRDVLAWFAPLAVRRLGARLIRAIRRSDDVLHWRVAIRIGHASRLTDEPADLAGFRWIESPRDRFYADPFVVERDGRRWLFFEDYSYARGVAAIAGAEIGPGGELGEVRDVLTTSGHLSYPMVFFDGSDALMVPESADAGVVRLHRAEAFPDSWSEGTKMLAEAAVDTTLWPEGGRWWLFTTLHEPRGRAGMLMLFHADTVDGPWTPHPLNPISQDVRTSRGGGSLFRDGDRLIRPSQDGSRGYGYRLTFNEITTLTEMDYAERTGPSVTPDGVPGLLGIHTYNRLDDVEVIDGKVARSRRTVA